MCGGGGGGGAAWFVLNCSVDFIFNLESFLHGSKN